MSLSPLSDYPWDAPELSLFGGDLAALDCADSPFNDCMATHVGVSAITEGQTALLTDHASKSSNRIDTPSADIFSDILSQDTAPADLMKEEPVATLPMPESKAVSFPLLDLVDQISNMPDEFVLNSTLPLPQTPPESPVVNTTFIPFGNDLNANSVAVQDLPISDTVPAVIQSNSQYTPEYTPPLTPSVSPAPLPQHDECGDMQIDDDELTNQLLHYLENAQAEMESIPQCYSVSSSMDLELTTIASEHLSNISSQDTLPIMEADAIEGVLSPESSAPVSPAHYLGHNNETIPEFEPSTELTASLPIMEADVIERVLSPESAAPVSHAHYPDHESETITESKAPSELKTLLLAPIPPVSQTVSPASQTVSSTDSESEDAWKLEGNIGPIKKGRKRTAVIVPPYRKDPTLRKCVNKKERKKQQNKEAATRYREKKRQESEGIEQEEQELLAKNKELRDKVSDISKEISYLKNLLLEVHKAKLLGKAAN